MHGMVKELQNAKKTHEQGIENLTLSQLKEKSRRCYVPRRRNEEELLAEAKVKKSWKGSGSQNAYFMEPPIMKPKILDSWTLSRV